LERWYATRANRHKFEVSGASHAVYVSHPEGIAAGAVSKSVRLRKEFLHLEDGSRFLEGRSSHAVAGG